INIPAGGDLQSAINSAQPGDVIKLAAGATFTGNFTLPVKSGSSYIYIRTSAPDSSLPAAGTRVTPSNAASMPKIVTSNSIGAITTDPAAHHYRFVGIELAVASSVTQNYAVLSLGDASSAQSSMSQVPHDIILDRCYIHGNSTGDMRRGIALNS